MKKPTTEIEAEEFLREYKEKGSLILSQKYNKTKRTMERWRRSCEKIIKSIPEEESIKGRSVLKTWRDDEGNYCAEWTKTNKEYDDARERIESIVEALKEDLPRYAPKKPPLFALKDLLTTFNHNRS